VSFYQWDDASDTWDNASDTWDNPVGWAQAAVTAQAPAGAAYAAVLVTAESMAASAVMYVDEVGLFPGTNDTWTAGGFVGSSTAVLTRSDGVYVRGASPANPLAIPASGQLVLVNDYEAAPYNQYCYSAVVSDVVSSAVTVASPPSESGWAELETTGFWWLDPTNPPGAVEANLTQFNPQVTEQSTAHLVMGQSVPNVVASAMGGTDGTGEVWLNSVAAEAAFSLLLKSQRTLFLSSSYGQGYYVRIAPSTGSSGGSGGSGNMAKDQHVAPSTASQPVQTINITWVAQARPPV
jgi:hypothetical protein